MAVRWERDELKAAADRSRSDRWSVEDCSLTSDGWLRVVRDKVRRVYAPTEHPELPHQLAKVSDPAEVLRFAETYGRLGYMELGGERAIDRVRSGDVMAVYDEPLDWILAHARTIRWCLDVSHALKGATSSAALQRMLDAFPSHYALGARIEIKPTIEDLAWLNRRTYRFENGQQIIGPPKSLYRGLIALSVRPSDNKMPVRERVGRLMMDAVHVNISRVRRHLFWRGGRPVSFIGGTSLLDAIYSIVADAITGGTLARCAADGCGAVFIQTDQRQKFCPPRDGQDKSPCGTLMRMRALRRRQKTIATDCNAFPDRRDRASTTLTGGRKNARHSDVSEKRA